MSYSRSYHESVTVSGSQSRSVSYPKSETGGSMTVTVNYTERVPVDITINVDTIPFDRSVLTANENVNLLTGSVVATEAAHVAAKVKNAAKISDSITKGFFGLIQSEISQQLAEMKPRIDALLVEMIQYQEACRSKKEQLESDFRRITERHSKLFLDLDKELHHRVYMLNQSAITALEALTACTRRPLTGLSAGVSTVFNKEGSYLQSILFATGLKRKAVALIENAKKYLQSEKDLSTQLDIILENTRVNSATTKHIPVIYFEASRSSDTSDTGIVISEKMPSLHDKKETLKEAFLSQTGEWENIDAKDREHIDRFLTSRLSGEGHQLTSRIADQIMRLWKQDTDIQTNVFNYSA